MKRSRPGFTLIEVAIFLAITGILFLGVTVGVQNSISQQRTNDSVQNFVEFLRGVYSEVSNVQHTDRGRSEKAVYGKLITFGERFDLAGNQLVDDDSESGSNAIFVYTVIGNVSNGGTGGGLDLLRSLNANVIKKSGSGDGASIALAGIAERYTPKWAAQIEPACENDSLASCTFEPMKGMVLIARHPNSGVINTYYSENLSEVNEIFQNAKSAGNWDVNPLTDVDFEMGQIDFCVNTTGEQDVYNRTDVRILRGAENASNVEIVPSGSEGYKCGE